jgi:hypothetical protein
MIAVKPNRIKLRRLQRLPARNSARVMAQDKTVVSAIYFVEGTGDYDVYIS